MNEVKCSLFVIMMFLLNANKITKACEKLTEVRGVKAYCWSSSVSVGDKIQQMEKRVEEMAAGFKEPTEPQKCDYYYCIFKQMDLLNPNYDVPCLDRLTEWINKNVPNDHAKILLERVNKCTDELKRSFFSEVPYQFLADNVDKPQEDKIINTSSGVKDNCSVSAEYMKCLGTVEKTQECPIFTSP